MEDSNYIINTCINLLTSSQSYILSLKTHDNCKACISCNPPSHYISTIPPSEDIISTLSSILRSSQPDSAESQAFSMLITKQTECVCSHYEGKYNLISDSLIIPTKPITTSLQSQLLSDSSIYAYCPIDCEIRLSSLSTIISRPGNNYILSLSWPKRSLDLLFSLLLAITSEIDLYSVYGSGNKKYIYGLVVQGANTMSYINLKTLLIKNVYGESPIYLEYLPFLILQYSLYPIALVYEDEPQTIWQKNISMWKPDLENFYRFLKGLSMNIERVCYFCWNQSHELCVISKDNWKCLNCGLSNRFSVIFCSGCSLGRQNNSQGLSSFCRLCLKNSESIYCDRCSVFAKCAACARNIYITQAFRCPCCWEMTDSTGCTNCGMNLCNISIVCLRCSDRKLGEECKHKQDKRYCRDCLHEFTCSVCRAGKLVFESQICWKCKGDLSDRSCNKCKKNVAAHSIVCKSCRFTTKQCKQSHIITKESIISCPSCAKEEQKYCKSCPNLKNQCRTKHNSCVECSQNSPTALICILCSIKGFRKHNCDEFNVCSFCYSSLDSCACGSKFLSTHKSCIHCKSAPSAALAPSNCFLPESRGWTCKNCNLSNPPSFTQCENCNLAKDFNSEIKFTCSICSEQSASGICEKCFKYYKCAECAKVIIAQQGKYCMVCTEKTLDGVCFECKEIKGRTEIICFVCAQMFWKCTCGTRNKRRMVLCVKCNKERTGLCGVCGKSIPVSSECWRCPKNCEVSLLGDSFCCEECMKELKVCSCTSKLLPTDKICHRCKTPTKNNK